MAFTYAGTLTSDRELVRFHLGDVTSGAGPLPADANFTDAELDGLITAEGSWRRAVAGGFERLASAWARYVSFSADGTQVSRSDAARQYQALATQWRQRYGGTSSAGSDAVTRADGFSQTYDNVTPESTVSTRTLYPYSGDYGHHPRRRRR